MTELIDSAGQGGSLSNEQLLGIYRTMLLARVLDKKIWGLNRMGKAAFVVSAQGHEAAQVGAATAIRAGHDYVLPYYRDLGVMLTLGMTPKEILLGVFARAEDPCSGGRQMPNHWGSSRLRVISGSSPIATQLPHAAGLAYAVQQRGGDEVAVSFFGEGAASKGDFHETLNFAGIHRLPMVFICENNGYAISVPLAKESATTDISNYAAAYGFEGVSVDGNDALAVHSAVEVALHRARSGGGPALIECKTYRFMAHTSDDDDRTYRTKQEVDEWKARDPLLRMAGALQNEGLLEPAAREALEEELQVEIDQASLDAEASAQPEASDAFKKVFARELTVRDRPRQPTEGTERTIIDTVRQTLHEAMERDERVVVLGEDVGPRGGVFRATDGLHATFGGGRVIDTPLAESSIVGIGIGLALSGLRPVVEIQFADFIHSAFDQIVSEAAKMHYRSNGDFHVPLVIRAPWGGGVHGALYHSQSIEAFYAHVAGLKVVAPSTPADVAGMLRAAIEDPDPVLFLEHKKTYRAIKGPVPEGDWIVPLGVADIAREGTDVSVITYGLHRHLALEAADVLAAEGVSVEVVDLRTISPLDREAILGSASKCGRVLLVHEDSISFGVGAEVAALIAEHAFWDLDAPVQRLAMADVPAMPFAAAMEHAVTIGSEQIVTSLRKLLDA